MADTYHDTVEAAKRQAEFEYGDVAGKWTKSFAPYVSLTWPNFTINLSK